MASALLLIDGDGDVKGLSREAAVRVQVTRRVPVSKQDRICVGAPVPRVVSSELQGRGGTRHKSRSSSS